MNPFYRIVRSCGLFVAIGISLSGSCLSMADEHKKTLLLYHSGLENFDSVYMMSLLVELENKLSHYKIKIINTGDLNIAQLKSQLEESESCVLTIGQQALETILATRDKTPIFSTLVSRINLDNLANSYARLGSRVTGIYEEQSFARQLRLSRAINPENKNIIVILGRKSRYYLDDYQVTTKKQSLNLIFDILKHQESPQQSLTRLSVNNGFLLILNTKQQYSDQDLQSLLITSHSHNIPMIGNKASDSKTAALASVYTPFRILAKETALGLQQTCTRRQLPTVKYAKYFSVAINHQLAKSLGYDSIDEKKLTKEVLNLEKKHQSQTENLKYE